MKSFNDHYSNIYSPLEIQLANEIAERLNNPAALTQFLAFTKEVPHATLRQFLNDVCSVADNKIRVSRAAIFVNSVNKYKQYGHGYSRN